MLAGLLDRNHVSAGESLGGFGYLYLDHLAGKRTGNKVNLALVSGDKNSAMGNFFNFEGKTHALSVPQLALGRDQISPRINFSRKKKAPNGSRDCL